jgi:hypothetical protein
MTPDYRQYPTQRHSALIRFHSVVIKVVTAFSPLLTAPLASKFFPLPVAVCTVTEKISKISKIFFQFTKN